MEREIDDGVQVLINFIYFQICMIVKIFVVKGILMLVYYLSLLLYVIRIRMKRKDIFFQVIFCRVYIYVWVLIDKILCQLLNILCGIIKIKYIYVIESEFCINIFVFILLWFFRIKEEVN